VSPAGLAARRPGLAVIAKDIPRRRGKSFAIFKPREQEAAIAELVPEIAGVVRFGMATAGIPAPVGTPA